MAIAIWQLIFSTVFALIWLVGTEGLSYIDKASEIFLYTLADIGIKFGHGMLVATHNPILDTKKKN